MPQFSSCFRISFYKLPDSGDKTERPPHNPIYGGPPKEMFKLFVLIFIYLFFYKLKVRIENVCIAFALIHPEISHILADVEYAGF